MACVWKFDGTNWGDLGGAGSTSGSDVQLTSLAVSKAPLSSDSLYLAYTRHIATGPDVYSVNVMRFNGVSWDFVGGPNLFTDSVWPSFIQIAIAPNDGMPYISIQSGYIAPPPTVTRTIVMAFK